MKKYYKLFNSKNLNIKRYYTLLLIAFLIGLSTTAQVYVSPAGSGTESGNSWANATTIAGLYANHMNNGYVSDEIWLLEGSYDLAFNQGRGLIFIYGGFNGTESLKSERNLTQNITIIENNYLVLVEAYRVVLDGITFQNSAVLFCPEGIITNCVFDNSPLQVRDSPGPGSLEITDSTFKNVDGVRFANNGAIFAHKQAIKIMRCLFKDNISPDEGGAITGSDNNVEIYESKFINNSAVTGGAIKLQNPIRTKIANSLFDGNSAEVGGAINMTGVIGTSHYLTVNTFVNNSGSSVNTSSGSAFHAYMPLYSQIYILNNIIWDNMGAGTQVYIYDENFINNGYGSSRVWNNLIMNNSINNHPHTQQVYTFDPLLNLDYSLSDCSPAINTGSENVSSEVNGRLNRITDLAGNPRIYNGEQLDLGAFESQGGSNITVPSVITQDISVVLDATGTATITASQIDNGSTDACGIPTFTLDTTSFDCTNIGENTVVLTLTNITGNSASANAIVTIEDNSAPVVVTQDITVVIDANGTANITANDIDNGSTDNCGIASLVLDITTFDCSNQGENTVALTATDVNGNSANANATVTVISGPIVITQDLTAVLDANGAVTITANDIDNGSTDNCGTPTLALDITSFDCTNLGENTVLLTVTNTNGDTASANAIVTIQDNMIPVITCPNDIIVNIDTGSCGAIVTFTAPTFTDNCNVVVEQIAGLPSGSEFSQGITTNTFQIVDSAGNIATCSFTVTVEDDNIPEITCINDIVIANDIGSCGAIVTFADPIFTDNCSVVMEQILGLPSGSEFPPGVTTNTFEVVDGAGNNVSCSFTVTVNSAKAPTVISQNISIQLDENGIVSINPADVDSGSFSCVAASLALDITSFDCTNIGENTVVLTVSDSNGNSANANAIVTVQDNTPPTVVVQNIVVALDVTGSVTISASDIDTGSFDNCGITTFDLNKTIFDCTNIGDNTVSLTLTDANGNSETRNAVVTVRANISPVISCLNNMIVDTDSSTCGAIVTFTNPIIESCSVINTGQLLVNGYANQDLIGWDITDFPSVGGWWIVMDGRFQTTIGQHAKSQVIDLMAKGYATSWLDKSPNIVVSEDYLGHADTAAPWHFNDIYFYTAELRDENGAVLDSYSTGELTCLAITQTVSHTFSNYPAGVRYIFIEHGGRPIESNIGNNGPSIDNSIVEIQSNLELDQISGLPSTSEFPIGTTTNTFEVINEIGTISSCSFTVTVNDTEAPIAVSQNITVQLEENGNVTISPADVDGGSTDNCGIANLTLDITTFNCNNVGTPTLVTLTATDTNGNSDSSTATVTVEDNGNCEPLGVTDFNLSKLLVYPNPTTDRFTIKGLENSSSTIQIISTHGQVIKTIYNYTSGDISIKNLENAVYFVKIVTNETSQIKRVVKNN